MFISQGLQMLATAVPWIFRGMGILFCLSALVFMFSEHDTGMGVAALLMGAVFYGSAKMASEIVKDFSENCRKNGL